MFSCQQKKTFEGICLAVVGTFQKSCEFFLYTKPFCEKPIKFYPYLWTCQVNKVMQDFAFVKKKRFHQFYQYI